MSKRLPPKESWIRKRPKTAGGEDEYVALRISHPTMQKLRAALKLMGSAAQDYVWMQQYDPKDRLRRAMEVILELTSVTRG